MKKCPLFGKCGGCKFDFASDEYRSKKLELLKKFPDIKSPIWIEAGNRRRADFSFCSGDFGFFAAASKDIIPVSYCPLLTEKINNILPEISKMPWGGAGSVLITDCDNGIDISVNSNVPYFGSEFRAAAQNSSAIRITWNGIIIKESEKPLISFEDKIIEYPTNAFLQPTITGANILRDMVKAEALGAKKIADLFCGLGNFTYTVNANGFDVFGGINRDLFKKPLTAGELKKYDCVVMDPPRAGAMAQARELSKSDVKKIMYISCNPDTFNRDAKILESGGFVTKTIVPIDQFIGSNHWEFFSVFEK